MLALAAATLAIRPPPRAEQQQCPRFGGKTCAGHGTCVNATGGAVCSCEHGYLHADCSYAAYCHLDCSGHGVCRIATGYNKTLHPEELGVAYTMNGLHSPLTSIFGAKDPRCLRNVQTVLDCIAQQQQQQQPKSRL